MKKLKYQKPSLEKRRIVMGFFTRRKAGIEFDKSSNGMMLLAAQIS